MIDCQNLPDVIRVAVKKYRGISRTANTPVLKIIRDLIKEVQTDLAVGINNFQTCQDCMIIEYLFKNIHETDINKMFIGPEKFYLPLKHFSQSLSDRDFWRILGEQYTMCNPRLGSISNEYFKLLKSKRPERNALMNKSELNIYTNLPSLVKVYRGMSEEEYQCKNYGYSWTLNEEIAKFFANKFYSHEGTVTSLTVSQKRIIAYFNEREEEEVIYL